MLTDEQLNQLYNEYESGLAVRSIAKDNNIHFTTLYNLLRECGRPFPLPQARIKKISLEDQDWIADLYEQGTTLDMLAHEFGVHRMSIVKILDKKNIKRRPKARPAGRRGVAYVSPELNPDEAYTLNGLTQIVHGDAKKVLEWAKSESGIEYRQEGRFHVFITKLTKYFLQKNYKIWTKNNRGKKKYTDDRLHDYALN